MCCSFINLIIIILNIKVWKIKTISNINCNKVVTDKEVPLKNEITLKIKQINNY